MLQLHKRLITETLLFHQKGAGNDLGLVFGVITRLQMALHVFFVSTRLLGSRGFGDRRNPPVSKDPKRALPGQV